MFIYEFMGGVRDTITGEFDNVEEGQDDTDFDPHNHRRVEKPTSYSETMMHMLKGSIGAGILAMPDGFRRMGVVYGSCGLFAIGIFATFCIHMLVFDYYEVVVNIRLHISILLIPLILINMVKSLKLLSPISSISNGITVVALLLVFFYLIEDDLELDNEKFKIKSLIDVPVFIGTTLFALEAVGVILALEYNLERPKRFTAMFGLFNIGMAIILSLYALVGLFGYLKYGEDVKASITLNLPQTQKKAQAAKLIFAMAIFLTFPLQNFVAYNVIWQLMKRNFTGPKAVLVDYTLRILLVIIPVVVAILVPSLGAVISLVGALCLSLLAIIFPAMIDICLWYPDQYGTLKYKLFRDLIIIALGLFALCAGVYTSILEMIE